PRSASRCALPCPCRDNDRQILPCPVGRPCKSVAPESWAFDLRPTRALCYEPPSHFASSAGNPAVQYSVFIHTNHRQMIGALVSQYSIRRNTAHGDAFDVRIIHTDDHPFLRAREGQYYLRGGGRRQWLMDDLQSFTPLRFMPPELMGYAGRAIVIDPDVFAVGDVYELLTRDMAGKTLMCRARKGPKGLASSVMLLDCAKLTHWRCAEQFDEMFAFK